MEKVISQTKTITKCTKRVIKINRDGVLIPIAEMQEKGDTSDRNSLKEAVFAVTRIFDNIQINPETEEKVIDHQIKRAREELGLIQERYKLYYLPELEEI